MNAENAWKKFLKNGSPLQYIEYSHLKLQEVNNAANNQRVNNKGDGYQGK